MKIGLFLTDELWSGIELKDHTSHDEIVEAAQASINAMNNFPEAEVPEYQQSGGPYRSFRAFRQLPVSAFRQGVIRRKNILAINPDVASLGVQADSINLRGPEINKRIQQIRLKSKKTGR